MPNLPVHRSIVAVDIEHSTGPQRTDPIRRELRSEVYRLLGKGLAAAGIGEDNRDRLVDRGDGVLALIHPSDLLPKTLLLNPLASELAELLHDHNAGLPPAERAGRELRLRMVIHAGEVHFDERGAFGESVDLACRLLDAPRLKKTLRRTAMPLAVVVSEDFYWSIVRHGYDGISRQAFQPMVRIALAGRRRQGWVHLPGGLPVAA